MSLINSDNLAHVAAAATATCQRRMTAVQKQVHANLKHDTGRVRVDNQTRHVYDGDRARRKIGQLHRVAAVMVGSRVKSEEGLE